ncbi:MAG: TAXI family TRAP transporter solute-binding subunit [Actinomycetaceae bacterium]|nr:TAXI family TRAP transporter solute-binding subunit [Actinomycetaceae bacterium]
MSKAHKLNVSLGVAAFALVAGFFINAAISTKQVQARQAAVAPASVAAKDESSVTVLTGPTSGIYYPIGNAFSKVLGDMGYNSTATATGATRENINAILSRQGELAIAMMDNVVMAIQREGVWESSLRTADLRAMMGLWPNMVQIVTTEDSGIKTFEDLRGKRVAVGASNSGVEINARTIFEAHGMSYSDINVDFLAYGEAIDKIASGSLDAAFVTSGLGNATIMKLGETKKIVFVPVEGEALQRLLQTNPVLVQGSIPKDVYGTEADTSTVGVMNVMLASKELSEENVYKMLDGFYSEQGLKTIGESYPIVAQGIQLNAALRGIQGTPIQLHPGAEKFYREKGLLQ